MDEMLSEHSHSFNKDIIAFEVSSLYGSELRTGNAVAPRSFKPKKLRKNIDKQTCFIVKLFSSN